MIEMKAYIEQLRQRHFALAEQERQALATFNYVSGALREINETLALLEGGGPIPGAESAPGTMPAPSEG